MHISIKPLIPVPSRGQWHAPTKEIDAGFLVTVTPDGGSPVRGEITRAQALYLQKQIGYVLQLGQWVSEMDLTRRKSVVNPKAVEQLVP